MTTFPHRPLLFNNVDNNPRCPYCKEEYSWGPNKRVYWHTLGGFYHCSPRSGGCSGTWDAKGNPVDLRKGESL